MGCLPRSDARVAVIASLGDESIVEVELLKGDAGNDRVRGGGLRI
jgi:hypothetical protein